MSAMWMGSVERFDSLAWMASRSIEFISPISSRRLASRRSRKNSSSLEDRPAWFFLGLLSPELETCSTRLTCGGEGGGETVAAGTGRPFDLISSRAGFWARFARASLRVMDSGAVERELAATAGRDV